MKTDIQERIEKIRQKFAEQGIEALLVLIAENRQYLSGFTGEDTGFDESAGALIITLENLILATDSRYAIQAEQEAPGYEVVCYKKGLAHELPSLLKRLHIHRLGYESRRVSVEQYNAIHKAVDENEISVDLVETREIVEALRRRKDESEIAQIRQVLGIAENAFSAFVKTIIPGMTEREAAWELEKAMREAGADALSFPVIAASGENSALPHAIPGPRRFKAGEPLLFDWGARLSGYCSDTSRTVLIGEPDDTYQKVFDAVYDAQHKAMDAIRPGKTTKEIDDIARGHLKDKELDAFFGHGLGHGVGLAVHESPSLSPLAEKASLLEEGMIVTVEPGVYIPDWGGVRLENMVAVRNHGPEILNRLDVRINLS